MDLNNMDADFQAQMEAAFTSGNPEEFLRKHNFPQVMVDPDDAIDEDDIPKMSPEDAIKASGELSASVRQSYKLLGDALSRYEDVIRKSWLKKTTAQRKQILLKAWPNVGDLHPRSLAP